jgi:ADP-ribose pyrophosphatase
MTGARDDVEVIEREATYRGYLRIDRLRLRHRKFAGGWTDEVIREVMDRAHAVAVLPYDPNRDEVVLIEQFRPGVFVDGGNPWMIEDIAGIIENDEPLESVARRETREEAGLEIKNLLRIGGVYASPGVFTEFVHIYLAHVDSGAAGGIHGVDHEHEDIRVFACSLTDAVKMMNNGQILICHAVVALQWLLLNRESVRSAWLGSA